jgi:hypothetical protein
VAFVVPGNDRFVGMSYGALLTRLDRDALVDALAARRFTGWVSPACPGAFASWTVAVPEWPLGHVAAHRMRLEDLAGDLGDAVPDTVVAVLVDRDRSLTIAALADGAVVLDYQSNPQADDDEPIGIDDFGNPIGAPDGPVGAERAPALARAAGASEAGNALRAELIGKLNDSESESERLLRVVRVLGWPEWVVSAGSLPRRPPGGPEASEFVRLRAGRTGLAGMLARQGTKVVRRSGEPVL